MTIDESSIHYLHNLLTGLRQHKDTEFMTKMNRTIESKSLDYQTVELVEKVLDFMRQALQEQQSPHTKKGVDYKLLDSIDCKELYDSIKDTVDVALSQKPKLNLLEDKTFREREMKVHTLFNGMPFTAKIKVQATQKDTDTATPEAKEEVAQQPVTAEAKEESSQKQGWGAWAWNVGAAAAGKAGDMAAGVYKGAVNVGAAGVVKVGGALLGRKTQDVAAKIEKYKEILERETKSTVASQFAEITAKTTCDFLEDAIVKVKEREPIVRQAFLKGNIFTDETAYTTDPELTGTGKLLSDLLVHRKPEFEKIIEANILKATSNVVTRLNALKQNPETEFFLVDLLTRCLEDVAKDIKGEEAPEQQMVELMKTFGQKATDLLFNMAMPGGPDDLIIPYLPGLGDSTDFLPSARPLIWELVQEVIKGQIDSFVVDLSGKTDLKNMLLIEGYGALLPVLAGGKTKTESSKDVGEAVGKIPLAPIGFAYVFLRLIATSVASIFREIKDKPPAHPYNQQTELNKHLAEIAHSIIQDSGSPLLKMFLTEKNIKVYVEELGPKLVDALYEVDYIKILNQMLESLVSSVISPGGKWEDVKEEKKDESKPEPASNQDAPTQPAETAKEEAKTVKKIYTRTPELDIPQTLEQEHKKEYIQKRDEEMRAKKVEELEQKIGEDINGLVDIIAAKYKLEHKGLSNDEKENIAHKVREFWIDLANSIITTLIKLALHVLQTRTKLKAVSSAAKDRVDKIEQDTFVAAVGDFAVNKLRTTPPPKAAS